MNAVLTGLAEAGNGLDFIHRACRHSFTPEPSDDYCLRSFLSVLDQQASNNVSFALEVGSFFQ